MKLKRILAVALVVAMLLAAAPALQLAPSAHAAVSGQNYLPLNYGGYSSVKDDGALGGMNANDNMQTAQGAVDAGYFNRCTPNATWQIIAPEDGNYEFRFWTFSDIAVKGLVAVLVNDRTAVTEFMDSGNGDEMWSSLNFSVPLQKGMNIVRFLPRGGSTSSWDWCDTAWMNADDRLTVVEAKDSGVLTLNASDAHYITNWGQGESYQLGDLWRFSGLAAGINEGNWGYTNFGNVPSYTYTVEVPVAGYYDIKAGFSTGKDASHWKIMLRVNNTNYRREFDFTPGDGAVNASVYLDAGVNSITFSAASDLDGNYPDWYNPTSVTFYGGITLSDKIQNPGETHAYNEYSATGSNCLIANRMDNWDWAYGANNSNTEQLYNLSTIRGEDYLNKRDARYVACVVEAPEAGWYTLTTHYSFENTTLLPDYRMVYSVNDTRYYTGPCTGNNWCNLDEGMVNVYLEKGRNVVRLLPMAGDSFVAVDSAYIGLQNFGVDNRLTVLTLDAAAPLTLKPGASAYFNKWSTNDEKNLYNVESGATMNVEALNAENLTDYPFFSFTVNVPADGYYDIDYSYWTNPGRTEEYGKCYIVVRVDDQNNKCEFDFSDGGGAGNLNASVYMTAGTHVVTFTSFVRNSDNYVDDWFDVTEVKFYGGVTLAETQLHPQAHRMDTDWTTENDEHFHKCTIAGCPYTEDRASCSGGTATCTEAATCAVCGQRYGNPNGHDYKTEWNKGNEDGHWHDCVNCDEHTTPEAHVPGDPATEDTDQVCTVCGYVIAPALGHVHTAHLTLVPAKAASCLESGNTAYYLCSCNKLFADDQATTEVTLEDVTLSAPGHDWVDATCTEPKTCRTCQVTEGDALGHSFTYYVSNEDATCTADGTETAQCDRCTVTDTRTEEGSRKPHAWTDGTQTEAPYCVDCQAPFQMAFTELPVTEDKDLITMNVDKWNWGSFVYGTDNDSGAALYKLNTMLSEGYLNKRDAKYVTYILDAPEAGWYTLAPHFSFENLAKLPQYQMVLSVNDSRYYTGKTPANNWSNCEDDPIAVYLDEGRNVVRLLMTACDGFEAVDGTFVALWGLGVDNRLTVVDMDALNLRPGEAVFVNGWDRGDVGNLYNIASGMTMDVDGWKDARLTDCPFFSFTVEIPADGYYDMNLRYYTNPSRTQSDFGDGYVVVNVDGENHKCGMDFSNGGDTGVANVSVYLTAGTRVLTVSGYVRSSDNQVMDWFDVTELTIYGGVNLANEQVNPAGNVCTGGHTYDDCMDGECNVCGYPRTPSNGHSFSGDCDAACNNDGCGYTREVTAEHTGGTADCMHKAVCEVCGEEYGELGAHDYENGECTLCGARETGNPATGRPDSVNTYVPGDGYLYTSGLESWDWGSTVYGLGGSNQGVPHTVDTIQAEGYLNKRDLPYAALVVDAPQDGTYYLYPKLSGSISGITLVASANDADYVTAFMIHEYTNCPYNHTGHDGESTFFNDSVVELAVNLQAGRNVIRLLLTAGSDYQDSVASNENPYMALSRVCVDNRLTVVRNDALTLKPGQSSYYHLWESNGQSLWNVGGGSIVMNVDGWKGPDLTDCPYFSFTVDVPKDGYYDIDLGYYTNPERTQANGYEGYVVVNVDGTNHKCGMDCSAGGGAGVMNASVYLTAGTHVLTFSSFVRGSDNLVLDWFDVTDLTIHGGVTLANEQVNPAGNVCTDGHTYDDCMDGECNICGYLRTPANGHSFSGDCDDTCDNNGCGYTREVTAEHTGGTADCKHKATCEVCGTEYGELGDHRGGTANCQYKAVCVVCGEEYGELGAHEFVNGECKICGVKAPESTPPTGDGAQLTTLIAVSLISLAGVAFVCLNRKRLIQ